MMIPTPDVRQGRARLNGFAPERYGVVDEYAAGELRADIQPVNTGAEAEIDVVGLCKRTSEENTVQGELGTGLNVRAAVKNQAIPLDVLPEFCGSFPASLEVLGR